MILPPRPLAPYETMAMPSLSDAQLQSMMQRHGLTADGPIVRLRSLGVVHSLWALGSQWVLRVPKNEPMSLGDHRCEAVAIPIVRRTGVRTPALVVFDDSLDLIEVPFSIVERVDGIDLTELPVEHDAWIETGRELARLHDADLATFDHPWLRNTDDVPAEAHLDDVIAAGLLHADGADWFRRVCERLDAVIADSPRGPRVFIHDDIKADNVMIDVHGRTQLIDWGDAGFGDPAHDFQSLPLRSIVLALQGYRSVRPDDPALEARIVRRVIARSMANLRRTLLLGPSWYRPIAATVTDLLTFAVDDPATWRRWTSPSAMPAHPSPTEPAAGRMG